MALSDIIFFPIRKSRPLHWIIAFAGSNRFSHCCIVTDEATRHGIAAREWGGVKKQRATSSDATSATVAWRDPEAMQEWLEDQLGKPYDFAAWVRCIFRLRSSLKEDRFTCSALVMRALEKFGPSAVVAYREVTPDELATQLGL